MKRARIVLCLGLLALIAGCLSKAPSAVPPESATGATTSAVQPFAGGPPEASVQLPDSLTLSAPPSTELSEDQRQTQALAQQLKSALGTEDYDKVAALLTQHFGSRASIEGALKDSLAAETLGRTRQAAENGNHAAQLYMGFMYLRGTGVPKDTAEAAEWFRKAAEQGCALAQSYLAALYYGGNGVVQDKGEAVQWWRKAAEQGQPAAQCMLGVMYASGEGVTQELTEAAKWFRRAADQGYAEAEFFLGRMYYRGEGVTQGKAEALKWYSRAAEQGNASAQFNLGLMYYSGDGVQQDRAEAVQWFRKATGQGSADAQVMLGGAYMQGEGVAKDTAEAATWYRKAAEQGDATGQAMLAMCYASGLGVLRSPSVGLEWYSRAANTYLAEKDREKALLCYDQMKGIEPQNPLTRALYSKLYAAQGAGTGREQSASMAGTGWPVTGGFVVTCYHVVRGASKVTLRRSDGAQTPASVVLQDAANDLAILRPAEAAFLPAALPLSHTGPRVGQSVFAVGYPLTDIMGASPKTTEGIVNSALGFGDDPRTFQISAALQAGNSGGPVLDMSGQVVGIALAKLNAVEVFKWSGDLPENVGYAVKVPYLQALLGSAPPGDAKGETLKPMDGATLDQLAAHVQGSVLLVIAEQ